MLWNNSLVIFYSAMLGGLIGSFISFIAMKGNQKQNMQMLELYWNEDIKNINLKIDNFINESTAREKELCRELSTKSGGKHVNNASCFSHGKPLY